MKAVWVPLAGAFAIAVTTLAVLPSDTQAQQGVSIQVSAAPGDAPVAQPSPAAKPATAPAQGPVAQPSPATAPAQAPRPAASPAALPRTGEANPAVDLWMALLGGAALLGGGALVLARRRGSA